MRSITGLALLLCASVASAARLTVSIPSSPPLLPNPATLPPSTHAVLIGPPGIRYDAPIRRDSTFIFPDLAEASYLLTLHSRDYSFAPLRVDVTKAVGDAQQQTVQAWQTFRGNEWSNKGPFYGSGTGELQVQLQPSSRKDFYQPRGGFSIISFVKSPMILMALVSAAMIFGLPYLMENMDPETKAEFEDMQKKGPLMGSQGPAEQIQNFDFASWMAGKGTGADSGSSGGGGKKR